MVDVAADGTVYMAAVKPGYVRHSGESLRPAMTASGVTLTLIAFTTVALRLFTRTYIIRNSLYFDDLLVTCAMIMAIVMLGVSFPLQQSGVGIHYWDVTFEQYNPGLGMWTAVTTCFYALGVTFSKLSILAFYLRLSPNKVFRVAVWTLFGLVSSYSIAYILAFLFRCNPVAAGWDVTIQALPTTKCSDMLTIMMVLSIANICMDIIILLLPIPVVLPLQMRTAQKLSLVLIFSTGAFVCGVAIKRTLQMQNVLGGIPEDYTWDIVEQFHWSYLEVDLGIVCASVPALKPLVKRYLGPLFSSRMRSSRDASKMSTPYSTAARRNQKIREARGEAYELGSRDDKFDAAQEDEARLWTKSAGRHNATVVTSKGRNAGSDSDSDLAIQADKKHSLTGNAPGISVVTETTVNYGRSRS